LVVLVAVAGRGSVGRFDRVHLIVEEFLWVADWVFVVQAFVLFADQDGGLGLVFDWEFAVYDYLMKWVGEGAWAVFCL
jgi:hypothetical protein